MALRLHLVYAGRGDAFVLEDSNQLWVIDGGPLGRSPESRGGAPYHRYLLAALLKVAAEQGQPPNTLTLSGVVVSHAHEDHYGGILQLFRAGLSPTYAAAPTSQWPLAFNGPLVTQPLTDLSQVGQTELLAALGSDQFTAQALPAPAAIGPFQFGDDNAFPRTVYGRASTARQPLRRIWTVDESPDNLASVLMFHQAGRMLFTGDSIGAKVLPFIEQVAQGQPLAVFKVPHHGSLRNSQRTGDKATVPTRAWHEYALLCVILDSNEWDAWGVPGALRVEGPMDVAGRELEDLCLAQKVKPETLEEELRTAVSANLNAAAAGSPVRWTYATSKTVRLWTSLVQGLETRALMASRSPTRGATPKRGRTATLEPVDRSWYWALLTPALLTEPFLSELAWTELKAFYSGFAAYNYVISADGSHGHPAAETIAAIVASRDAANPTGRVFVTDASSVDLDRIGQLAGPGWRNKIDLRALTSGSEIVIDLSNPDNAKPSNPATPPLGTSIPIDPLQTTTSVAALAEPTREALHRQLQEAPGASIPRRAPTQERYLLKVPGASLYLGLDAQGDPSVTAAQTTFNVEEAWLLQPPQPEITIVRLQVATTSPGPSRLVKLIDRGGGRWALQLVPETAYVSTNAAQGYRTQDLNDPNLAEFEFSEFSPGVARQPLAAAASRLRGFARRLGAGPAAEPAPSLRSFLQAAGLPSDGPLTGRAALVALVGPGNAAAAEAGINLPVLDRIFGWEADLDRSTVSWSGDGEGLLVTGATLAVAVGSPSTFTIEGVTETIVSTSIAVARSESLTVTAALHTADKTDLDEVVTIDSPGRGRPLAEYLGTIGVETAKQSEVTVAGLLSRMLGRQSRVEDLLMSAPSFVAAAGIGTVTLDVEASEVETFASPTGGIDVRVAKLVTKQATISQEAAGISLTLEDATLTVEDALLPTARVVLGAVAKITPAAAQSQPVALRAEIVLTDERPELSLSLVDGAGSLQQVIALLPGAPSLGNLEVPVAAKTLSSLSLGSLGLALRQPVEDADSYVVSSVFGAFEFSGWDAILPLGFPTPASSSVRARVFEPENATQRRVGFDAEVSFALSGGRTLAAEVRAWPMSGSGETGSLAERSFAKSVALWADPQQAPVTLADALSAFGLPSLAGALPALGTLLSSVALEGAEIELEDTEAGGTAISSFELGLWISQAWTPLAGFSLTGGQLYLRYDGVEWSGEVGASMLLGDSHVVEAGYVVPTATTPGAFTFAPVTSLTLEDAADLLGLGSLSGVPLLGPLLETVFVTEVDLALAASSAAVPTVSAWSLGLLLDTIQLGPLTVDGVAIDLARTAAAAGGESETSLWLEAELGGSAILSVEWSSAAGKLAGTLRMVESLTVGEMLSSLFGSDAPRNVLLPIVGKFAVIGAEVEFDTSGKQLKAFRLDLDTSRSLTLGPATIASLSIAYAAASPGGAATYVLTGEVTGSQLAADIEIDCQAAAGSSTVTASVKSGDRGNEALTLSGLLSIFGLGSPTVPPLQGAPNFLALEIAEVAAELVYSGGLGLEKLTAKVRSASAISLVPTTPPIELEKLGLDVTYEKAGSPALTGVIFGTLTVPTSPSVTLDLEYSVGKDGTGVFEGNLAATEPPDFKALLAQGAYGPGAGGGVPSDIGLPQAIPMAELAVRVEMATASEPTSVAVSGYAKPTEWKWESLGVDFAVEELGGQVVVIASQAAGGTPQHDCSLFGTLSFDGFEGKAILSFGAVRSTVLTARASHGKSVQLPEVAEKLSSSHDTWADVVPAGTAPLGFGDGSAAFAYLDLTAGAFALYGSLAGFGTGALVSHVAGGSRSYAFLAGLSRSFCFKNLWSEVQAIETIDDYVAVRSANLAILDYAGTVEDLKNDIAAVGQAARAQGVPLELPFAGLDWLGEAGSGPPQLTKGGAFFADLALSADGTLSRNLLLIAAEPTAATIALYALVDHAEPQHTVYMGRISDLKLLGDALTLSGAVTYRPAADAKRLEVSGSLTLVLASGEEGHEFEGSFTLDTEKATFTAATGGAPISIEDPFGGMFGITISKAALTAEIEFKESGTASVIVVSGEVMLKAGAALPAMQAAIAFLQGRPALASVYLPDEISVDELLEGIRVPWPSGYEVLSFEKGSIYYAPAPVAIGGTQYSAGYHMTTIAKVLGHPVGIDVEVDSNGIVVQAVINEGLDFYFLQLTGYTEHDHRYEGPFLSIDARSSPSFTIGAGVSLFNTAIASTTVTYQRSLAEWTGSVTPPSSVPVLGGQAIEFSYSEAAGFRLTNLEVLSDLVKWTELAEQLTKASEGTACGELVGLAWESVVTTRANVKFTSGEATTEALPVSLEGTFDVLVAEAEVVSVPLPTLTGTIPKPKAFELEELPSWVATLLAENLVALAKSLLDEKTKLAVFMGALAGLTASKKGLAALICSGVKTENVETEVETSVDSGFEDTGALETEVAKTAGEAMAADSLATAAQAAAAAAAAFVSLAALVDELVDLIGSALDWLVDKLTGKKEKAEGERETAKGKLDEAESFMAEVLTMAGAPTAAFATGSATTVQVSWTDADRPSKKEFDYEGYVGIEYQVQVSTSSDFKSGAVSDPVEEGGSPITVELPQLALSSYAYARVRAVYRHSGREWQGPWREAGERPFHSVPLAAPATVSQALVDEGDTIAVTVAAVAEATGYLVTLVEAANPSTALLSQHVPAPASGPAVASLDVRSLPNSVPTGASLVAVAVAEGDPKLHVASPPTQSAPLASSAPPSAPAVAVESDGLHVTWAAVPGASRCEVRVVDSAGEPLTPQPAILSRDPGGTGLLLGAEGIADGSTVGVELRTPDSTQVALWSSPATQVSVPMLAAPGHFAAVFESPEDILLLSWDEDPRASSWEVECTDAAGGALSPPPSITAGSTGASVSGSAIAVGGSYRVRARPLATGSVSLWSEWLPVTAAAVASPTGVSLAFSAAAAEASWQAVDSASAYHVVLLALPAGAAVARQSTPATNASFEVGAPIGPEMQCEVAVRAQVETSIGPAAGARAAAPSLLELVEASHGHDDSADTAAAAALAYQPALGYAELLVTLAAAGYPAPDAKSATASKFPEAPLDPLVAALTTPAKLALLLRPAGVAVAVAVTVRLTARLYQGKPVELAIQLRLGGLAQGDVAAALPGAYASVSPEAATAIAAAVYAEPWALGAQLHAGGVDEASVVSDLLDAYPELPVLRAMASLYAYYEVSDETKPVGSALAKYGGAWVVELAAFLDREGKALASYLNEEGASPGEAADYVGAAYPKLGAKEVQEAIDQAFRQVQTPEIQTPEIE